MHLSNLHTLYFVQDLQYPDTKFVFFAGTSELSAILYVDALRKKDLQIKVVPPHTLHLLAYDQLSLNSELLQFTDALHSQIVRDVVWVYIPSDSDICTLQSYDSHALTVYRNAQGHIVKAIQISNKEVLLYTDTLLYTRSLHNAEKMPYYTELRKLGYVRYDVRFRAECTAPTFTEILEAELV